MTTSWDDESSVGSLEVSPPMTTSPKRPAIPKDRSSRFYAGIVRRRGNGSPREESERQFGWGGNARAMASPNRTTFDAGAAENTIAGQVDERDLPTLPVVESDAPATTRVKSPWFSCCSSSAYEDDFDIITEKKKKVKREQGGSFRGGAKRSSPPKTEAYAAENEKARWETNSALVERRNRGSVQIDAKSGAASIPLYGSLHGGPALSSFRPVGPLQTSAERQAARYRGETASQPHVAGAVATVDADGQLAEIKRQKGFRKSKARFSTFQGQMHR